MTMQKERDPLNPSSAAARAIEIAGVDAVADAIDRGPSLVRDWADDERPASPNLWQAMQCDALCIRLGGEAPFRSFFDRWAEAQEHCGEDAIVAAVLAVETAGVAAREIVQASDPSSESGRDFSPRERAVMNRRIQDAIEQLERARRSVNLSAVPSSVCSRRVAS